MSRLLDLAGGWLRPRFPETLLSEITTLRLLLETDVEEAEVLQFEHHIAARQIWLSWNLEAQLDPEAYLRDTLGVTRFQEQMIEPQVIAFYEDFLEGERSDWPEVLEVLESLQPEVPASDVTLQG